MKNPKKGDVFIVKKIDTIKWSPNAMSNKKLISIYPKFSDLGGQRVIFLDRQDTPTGCYYNVFLENYSDIELKLHSYLLEAEKIENTACKCNVFITGCICGVFQKEKAKKQ